MLVVSFTFFSIGEYQSIRKYLPCNLVEKKLFLMVHIFTGSLICFLRIAFKKNFALFDTENYKIVASWRFITKLVLFADDARAICRGRTQELLTVNINEALVWLEEWFGCNLLKMNTEKTQVLGFKCNLGQLKYGNFLSPLVTSDTVTFLSLYLDENFKFRTHI